MSDERTVSVIFVSPLAILLLVGIVGVILYLLYSSFTKGD